MTTGMQSVWDIDPQIKGDIILVWRCPRCGCRQKTKIKANDLIFGIKVNCSNVAVCGIDKISFDLSVDLVGYYKDCNDVPLCKEPA